MLIIELGDFNCMSNKYSCQWNCNSQITKELALLNGQKGVGQLRTFENGCLANTVRTALTLDKRP